MLSQDSRVDDDCEQKLLNQLLVLFYNDTFVDLDTLRAAV